MHARIQHTDNIPRPHHRRLSSSKVTFEVLINQEPPFYTASGVAKFIEKKISMVQGQRIKNKQILLGLLFALFGASVPGVYRYTHGMGFWGGTERLDGRSAMLKENVIGKAFLTPLILTHLYASTNKFHAYRVL